MMTKNVERKNVEGEAYIKNYHDPDFARIPLAHQVVSV